MGARSRLLAHYFCAAANSDSDAIHWVSVPEAQVKLDDKTPLAWNVYQPEKKNKKDKKESNLVLILLGHRYLLLDTHARISYEVKVADLKAQGANFDSGNLVEQSRVVRARIGLPGTWALPKLSN